LVPPELAVRGGGCVPFRTLVIGGLRVALGEVTALHPVLKILLGTPPGVHQVLVVALHRTQELELLEPGLVLHPPRTLGEAFLQGGSRPFGDGQDIELDDAHPRSPLQCRTVLVFAVANLGTNVGRGPVFHTHPEDPPVPSGHPEPVGRSSPVPSMSLSGSNSRPAVGQ